MIKIYYYLDSSIKFYYNLISAYDFFTALKINHKISKQIFDKIIKISPQLFNNLKRINLKNNQELETKIFINSSQMIFCLKQLKSQQLIDEYMAWQFLQWYTNIIDNCLEIWMTDRKEERLQDQLILLAGYGKIKLQQEVTVLALANSLEKTRRYDIVEFVNKTNTVRIRELKSRKINIRDIEITLNEKGYYQIATQRWQDKNIEFIFSSLEGIEESAELLIDNIEGVSFENIRDLGLRLYINALKHTPLEGWNNFTLNVVNKFLEILPEQKLLRSAEEDLKRKFSL